MSDSYKEYCKMLKYYLENIIYCIWPVGIVYNLPFFVKAQTLLCWELTRVYHTSVNCCSTRCHLCVIPDYIRWRLACCEMRGAVRGSILTHFSWFTLWKPWVHFNMESTTQQLFWWRCLFKCGVSQHWTVSRGSRTLTWRQYACVSEAHCIPEWVIWCWYCICLKAVEQ